MNIWTGKLLPTLIYGTDFCFCWLCGHAWRSYSLLASGKGEGEGARGRGGAFRASTQRYSSPFSWQRPSPSAWCGPSGACSDCRCCAGCGASAVCPACRTSSSFSRMSFSVSSAAPDSAGMGKSVPLSLVSLLQKSETGSEYASVNPKKTKQIPKKPRWRCFFYPWKPPISSLWDSCELFFFFFEGLLAVALLHHHAGHALDAVGSVVLVVGLPGHVLQVLHVRADEHVPQLHEIAVRRVLHCEAEDQAGGCGGSAGSAKGAPPPLPSTMPQG